MSSIPSELKSPTATVLTGSSCMASRLTGSPYGNPEPGLKKTSIVPSSVATTISVRPSLLKSPWPISVMFPEHSW